MANSKVLAAATSAVSDDPQAGVGALLIKSGEVLASHFSGLRNRELNLPFDAQTPFRMCSITKHFSALLLIQAVQAGRARLDDHPARHVPSLSVLHPATTLRQLCAHQAGLRDVYCLAMLLGAGAEDSFGREAVESLLPLLAEPQFSPGTQSCYSNTGYLMLGWVLEAIWAQPLASLYQDLIFAPLGMQHTYLAGDTGAPLSAQSIGYEADERGEAMPARVRLCWAADAGLVTTAADLVIWEGQWHRGDARFAALLSELQQPCPLADGSSPDARLGIRQTVRRDEQEWFHTGGLRGWRMARTHLPGRDLSVLVLFNHMADPLPSARAIIDAACGRPADAALAKSRALASPESTAFDRNRPAMTLVSAISGAYHCERSATSVHIRAQGQGAEIVFDGPFAGPAGQTYPLRVLGPDRASFHISRALDYPAPETVTVEFSESAADGFQAVTLGCWQCLGLRFEREKRRA
ncbi:MAG: serine hydrolase [Pseudomonadota bacterium]